ncbi:general stress protein [uncultured Exiguobacterium sp.]|uniref:general stress protein n=1 Tax=uncultured Exiguobacterium sp. TaxID=202669 RepID=UPI0025D3F526|nr:general stress protein [uncultured Exiguobacterium sp.]
MKRLVAERLAYLYRGELFTVITILPLSWVGNRVFPRLQLFELSSFWMSLFLFELLLIQGAWYWYSKSRQLKEEGTSITPESVVRRLFLCRILNLALIVLTACAFGLDWIRFQSDFPVYGLRITLFLYVFAILEYINYFHIQLMYDNRSDVQYLIRNRRLKRSALYKDIRRLRQVV